jgi:hypothetical protein
MTQACKLQRLQLASGTVWHCKVCNSFYNEEPRTPPPCPGPLGFRREVDESELARRLRICRVCEYYHDEMCVLCPCGMQRHLWERRLRSWTQRCPLGRWELPSDESKQTTSRDRVYVIGYPGPVGGADTECWHTVRLWHEKLGIRVTLVPTWHPTTWKSRCDQLGVETLVLSGPDRLPTLPGIERSIAVGFCNHHFLANAATLRKAGALLVWVSCMTWVFPEERRVWQEIGLPDAMVWQSDYQRSRLLPELQRLGQPNGYLIRGAFSVDEFPFQPAARTSGGPMTVCRIARADADKWHQDLWRIVGSVPDVSFIGLGWRDNVQARVGPPPPWAKVYPPGALLVQDVLRQSHVMLCLNSKARENWPQVALEAMASGVAVIAERRWGWLEMIEHGVNGILVDTADEAAGWLKKLHADETFRIRLITQAREWVESYYTRYEVPKKWARLFSDLGLQSRL